MKRRALCFVVPLVLALGIPISAAAQTPATETTLVASIDVAADGLSITFTATGYGTGCTWNFGDDTTDSGNPVAHTYAAAGTYAVNGSCSGGEFSLQVTASDAPTTSGNYVILYALIAVALLIFGGLIVRSTRKTPINT